MIVNGEEKNGWAPRIGVLSFTTDLTGEKRFSLDGRREAFLLRGVLVVDVSSAPRVLLQI